ncbi:MAG TPA: alpha/beta hydrolase fold domain-containing protein, partial [Shinella sp.]|nr:alpha/beta hydrolase fold domain-containing protein [Shinella sp.]
PYAAPSLCSRLSGVAPALVLSAADDPLLDEAQGYADRLRASGVTVQQHVLPAGTGWSSIYSGKSDVTGAWRNALALHFSDFVKDISIH